LRKDCTLSQQQQGSSLNHIMFNETPGFKLVQTVTVSPIGHVNELQILSAPFVTVLKKAGQECSAALLCDGCEYEDSRRETHKGERAQ
jgi:hypothetical protein